MRRDLFRWIGLALPLLVACGGGTDGGGGGGGTDEVSGFWIEIEPVTVEVAPDGDRPVFVTVRAPPGETTPAIHLRVEDLPRGVYALSTSISVGETEGMISIFAADDAPAARDVVARVVATGDGVEREATLRVTVTGGGGGCDPGFGVEGLALAVVGSGPVLRDLAVLDGGRIVAVGQLEDGDGWIALWDEDGLPDFHFGEAGVARLPGFAVQAFAIDPWGRMLLAGKVAATGAPALARLGEVGVDPEFGYVPLAAGNGEVRALAMFGSVAAASVATPAGHVLTRLDLSGAEVFPPVNDGPTPDFSRFAADGSLVASDGTAALRFDAEGHWDTDFGDGGFLELPNTLFSAVQPVGTDGRFLAGGTIATTAGTAPYVTRVAGDAVDPAFTAVRWSGGGSEAAWVVDLLPLDDGAAALAYHSPSRAVEAVVFDGSGQLRTSYGEAGVIELPFRARTPDARLAVDSSGDVFAGAAAGTNGVAICRIPR